MFGVRFGLCKFTVEVEVEVEDGEFRRNLVDVVVTDESGFDGLAFMGSVVLN